MIFPYVRPDGKELWLELSSSVIKDKKGRFTTVVQARDITAAKNSGEVIRASLQEKEILLREIHHRVKNNLQIISSLLNLQSQYVKDETALEMFKESRLRIRSMAMVHEKLYKSRDLSQVDFGDYVQSLAQNLFQVYGITPDKITLRVNMHGYISGHQYRHSLRPIGERADLQCLKACLSRRETRGDQSQHVSH